MNGTHRLNPPFLRRARSAILVLLALQIVAGFKLLAPPKSFPALAHLRIAPSPTLYPFLDYNMYIASHFAGEALTRRLMFGVTTDGRKVRIRSLDLGVSQQEFRDALAPLARARQPEALSGILRLYQRDQGIALVDLAFETQKLVITPSGVREEAPR